jgi:membrane protein YdbS with pleckstrin-like domain
MLQLENMRPWEKIVMVIKRHWIVFVILWIYFVLAIIVSISLYVLLWFNALNHMLNIAFWLIFSLFLYIEWLNHELDMYIVSDNRIIWVEQITFLNRTVSECNLWQVQEVNSKTSGLFANILNYWTLSIQTAWNKTTLKMDFCPDSMQAARKVLNIVDNYRDSNQSNNKKEDKQ